MARASRMHRATTILRDVATRKAREAVESARRGGESGTFAVYSEPNDDGHEAAAALGQSRLSDPQWRVYRAAYHAAMRALLAPPAAADDPARGGGAS